jgi:hypothetical protein
MPSFVTGLVISDVPRNRPLSFFLIVVFPCMLIII